MNKKLLDEPIPNEAVSTREAWKGGPKLSYLSGAYVINRLNQVLGQGNWGYAIEKLDKVFEGMQEQYSGEAYSTSYIAQVTLSFRNEVDADAYTPWQSFTEVGYGDGTDKKSPGKAHELATKEAVTDALKRAAKNLGMSMGLALYFKEGQFTGGEANEEPSVEQADTKINSNSEAGIELKKAKSDKKPADAKVSREKIKYMFGVLEARKQVTRDAFVKDYLGGRKVDDLDDANVIETLNKLQTNFPELGK